ncbi:dynein intermediate chain 3, axonemal [Carcharodon carcharias]|uniref:dynein intermediate chain 3, axonemal n=1 Tax=Carcharodon carcharias TaxID=13397 RepID=UPI001B7E4A63|nr:dynein intermediate chain 3, axonemal [Carcharodon carcharias]
MNTLGKDIDVVTSRSMTPTDWRPTPKLKDRVRSKTRLKSARRVRSSLFTEDIIPLVLTSKSREIFQCVIDQDLTEEQPYKLIKKDDIINDMKARGGTSDFYPFKQQILEHSTEDFLVVFDKDFKYGQSFYMVLNETMKEAILQSLEQKQDAKEEDEDEELSFKDFLLRSWTDLGSGIEIEQEKAEESSTKVKFMISRIRREFGAPVVFDDRNDAETKDSYIECTSYQDKNFSIKKLERDIGIQAVKILEESSTQTEWTYPRNACTQYTPSEFTQEEKDEILKSEALNTFINSVALRFELALQQNEIMDVFYDDWRGLTDEDSTFGGKADCHLKEYQSFTDLQKSQGKRVNNIEWHPTILGLVAVSVVDHITMEDRMNLTNRPLRSHSYILFWNFTDPIRPQIILEAPDDIYSFQFCPTDPNIVAGGCKNGQVVLWDISEFAHRLQGHLPATKPDTVKANLLPELDPVPHLEVPIAHHCAVSSIENGHKSFITDLCWLPDHFEITKFGVPCENPEGVCVQLVTCSPDCSILFWDVRRPKATVLTRHEKQKMEKELQNPEGIPNTFKHIDLYWKPMHRVVLPKVTGSGEYSPLKISLREKCTDKAHDYEERVVTSEESGKFNTEYYLLRYRHMCNTKSLQNLFQSKGETSEYGNMDVPSSRDLTNLTEINTFLFIGTEDGEVTSVDWQVEKDMDTGKMTTPKPTHCYTVHDGPVNTVQRSPFFTDIILTVGGWTFAIWKEGFTLGPLLHSACATKRCQTGHWSLTRPGVIIIGREDGNIDIWDLLEKTHEPSQTQNISSVPISCIRPWIVSTRQHLLAVSDDFGTLHILEVPWALRYPLTQEKSNVEAYFDREVKRLEYFEARKILRSEKKEQEEEEKPAPEVEPKTVEQLEEEAKKEHAAYLQEEKKIIFAQLGKV